TRNSTGTNFLILVNTAAFEQNIFHSKLTNFDQLSRQLFSWQSQENPVFQAYLKETNHPSHNGDPLFLPIELFKTHQVKSGIFESSIVFESSGTQGQQRSHH